jgi:hypothetical protein
MPRPKRFNFANPPIDGNYLPPSGQWTDLSGLVEFARLDAGAVREIPIESNAGPLLAPMWTWVRLSPGLNWCAPWVTWTWGRYFKSLNVSEEFPDGKDPQVLKGNHALRQQFARLGPSNTNGRWKGPEKYATIEGHDPRWVWFTPESVANGEIAIRPGDLFFQKTSDALVLVNRRLAESPEDPAVEWALRDMAKEHDVKQWSKIYGGSYSGIGHVGICTGDVSYSVDEKGISKITNIGSIQGNVHDRTRYGAGSFVIEFPSNLIKPMTISVRGRNEPNLVGFLRYIGDIKGTVETACNVDFSKYA